MLAVNIALKLKNNFNKINSNIKSNKIKFDENHIPHITLLQFYTNIDNITKIQKQLKNFKDIVHLLNNFESELIIDNYYKNDNIYKINIKSDELNELHKEIYHKFNKYVNNNICANSFGETVNNKLIPDVVLNFVNNNSLENYKSHITIGISNELCNLVYNKLINIESIELFRIGDNGTAMPLFKQDVFYFAHRINNIKSLRVIPNNYGIELDLRDFGDKLILEHDPFIGGVEFEEFLKHYNKSSIILNIKSERIEFRVLDLLKKYDIKNYFFLDSSFPMIYSLSNNGEKQIAIRFSEFESIESVLLMKNRVTWVWVDCFNNFPLDKCNYKKIKDCGLKICLVSPELQKHNIERIREFKKIIYKNNFKIDAICTKVYNINKWNL